MAEAHPATPWVDTIEQTQSKLLSALAPGYASREMAWRVFLEAYVPVMNRYAESAGASPGEVVDIVAEVVAKFCDRIKEGWIYEKGERPGRFRAYLRVTVMRTTQRVMSKSAQSHQLDNPDFISEPTDGDQARLESVERHVLFEQAARTVREQTSPAQFAAWERLARGVPAAEVAREFDVTIAAVYQYKTRVTNRLRAEALKLLEAQKE